MHAKAKPQCNGTLWFLYHFNEMVSSVQEWLHERGKQGIMWPTAGYWVSSVACYGDFDNVCVHVLQTEM